jgi:hypothetical protein
MEKKIAAFSGSIKENAGKGGRGKVGSKEETYQMTWRKEGAPKEEVPARSEESDGRKPCR